MTEETKREIDILLRRFAPEYAGKIRPGRMPMWAIAQCNDDEALDEGDGSIREQLFPGTIIQTSGRQIYPDTDTPVADLYSGPVLMTILSGTSASPEKPVWITPRKGGMYVGVVTTEVEEDRDTAVIGGHSQTVLGRSRFIGVEYPTAAPSAGRSIKVRAATVAAGTLSTSFENTDVIDGVTLATGDKILIKNQSSTPENGVYIVNASGAPTRDPDYDSGDELAGAMIVVTEGTHNADTVWICSSNHSSSAALTVGTDAITWDYVGPIKAGQAASSSPVTGTSDGVYYTACSISLPGPGTYHIQAGINIAAGLATGNEGYIYCRLFNATNSTTVSEIFPLTVPKSVGVFETFTIFARVTVTAASTINAEAQKAGGLGAITWSYMNLNNAGVSNRSTITSLRVG